MMPSFRGESSDESHLCQFYHVEAEIPGTLDDVMKLVEDYLRYTVSLLLSRCEKHIIQVAGSIRHLTTFLDMKSLIHISMEDATKILQNSQNSLKTSKYPYYRSLTRAGELELINRLGEFIWLTEPDHISVPFYQAFSNRDKKKAISADLLFGLGEVVGAGQRHMTVQEVHTALIMHEVDPRDYEWYLQMREQSPMLTSGFGLGTERFIAWVLQHRDIRDCVILPRNNGQINVP